MTRLADLADTDLALALMARDIPPDGIVAILLHRQDPEVRLLLAELLDTDENVWRP